jgi:undecaprenyl diphosphate synthase
MDGNRRWAAARNLSVRKGHEAGSDTLETIVRAAIKFGVKYLTVYALSTENLIERRESEISFLFSLLEKGIRDKLSLLVEKDVRLKCIGNLVALPSRLQKVIKEVEQASLKNKALFLNIAINYGGRDEIVHAVADNDKDPSKITKEDISNHLYTAGLPDPGLIIRTGGRMRLSNFLLWQSSYSELIFTNILWPDFSEKEFKDALKEYEKRVRNFGR